MKSEKKIERDGVENEQRKNEGPKEYTSLSHLSQRSLLLTK